MWKRGQPGQSSRREKTLTHEGGVEILSGDLVGVSHDQVRGSWAAESDGGATERDGSWKLPDLF